jgi:uncharacterized Zn-finger protein
MCRKGGLVRHLGELRAMLQQAQARWTGRPTVTAAVITLPCGGSPMPLRDVEIGETLVCRYCGGRFRVVGPPGESARDSWRGDQALRVERHELVWEERVE